MYIFISDFYIIIYDVNIMNLIQYINIDFIRFHAKFNANFQNHQILWIITLRFEINWIFAG